MRKSRLVPVAAAAALLVATTSPVQAQTEPEVTGVGTTTGALSLLGLDAGDLLTLDLLTDAGSANIDEAAGPRSAVAQISALVLESQLAGLSQELPLLKAESTGAADNKSQAVTPIDNPVLSGALAPLDLSALVDEGGAVSTLSAGLGQLQVLDGILGLDGAAIDLGNSALLGDSGATRGVDVDALTVLDLEALLAALGIPLTSLPLDALLGLIDGLGLLPQLQPLLAPLGITPANLSLESVLDAVDGVLDQADALLAQADTLTAQIGSLQAAAGTLTGGTTQVCNTVLQPVLGLLPGAGTVTQVCTDVPSALTTVTSQITTLQGTLASVRAALAPILEPLRALLSGPNDVLDLLSGQALLSLDGLDVNVVTKATDDVATSVADVTGTLGNLRVGELPVIGALDLTAPTAQLNGLLTTAQTQIGGILDGVLGGLVPGVDLSDLVQLQTMQETSSVEATEAGGVLSKASFTGLDVQVLPLLGDVTQLLAGLGGLDSVGDVLGGLGLPIPTSGAADVLALNTLIAPVTDGLPLLGGLAALGDGLGLQVATLSQQSTFTPFAASAPVAPGAPGAPAAPAGPTLPRTGSDDGLLLALAAAAVLAALGGRQLVRRSSADA